jgi:drug/metabolite transporter (DMT)-like permease
MAMPLVFVLIWSTGFVVAKFGLPYAPPLTFLLLRFAGVLMVLLPLMIIMRVPWPKGQTLHIAVSGILMQAGYLAGVWCAIKLGMPAGLSALIVGMQPVLIGLSWQSIALCLLALFSITIGTLYQKRYCASFDLRAGTAIQFAASFAIVLPFAIVFEHFSLALDTVQWTPSFVGAWLWSVFALSIGAIFLLFALIRKSAATQVTSLLYLTPPTTAVMAWIMFNEAFSIVGMIGMLIAVLGVAFVVKK